ncbi:hypothetical protein BJY04DRAFT_193834 [Aspergillus karnatakaensis]|uniref:uncharacterized protein n=1 Tax=Aspergillus karnatakaensis TaxID=1810916 RepID=UPI003CCC9001
MSEHGSTTSFYNLPQGPSPDWVRFKPAPHECASCTLCTTGLDCPAVAHPFNNEGETGLRCYRCSACSHHGFKSDYPDIPQAYKSVPDRFFSTEYVWFVHVPIDDRFNAYNSQILKLRVALAEMDKAKATIYAAEERDNVPLGAGLVFEVWMKKSTGPKTILDEAREMIKGRLRAAIRLFTFEEAMGLSNA